jgi:hypothetical protein
MNDLLVIQGCPVNKWIAPYFYICVTEAKATVNSIYRGDDAASILHAHGKHTQREIYNSSPPGVANPPGRSTHELRSDGHAYPHVPAGGVLAWWQEGIDVNDGDVNSMIKTAHKHGWALWQPYKSGVEFHHLNFVRQPVPADDVMKQRIITIRSKLPNH